MTSATSHGGSDVDMQSPLHGGQCLRPTPSQKNALHQTISCKGVGEAGQASAYPGGDIKNPMPPELCADSTDLDLIGGLLYGHATLPTVVI